MKLINSLLLCLLIATSAFAQEDAAAKSNWTQGGNVGLNFTQVALSNWAGGGKSTIALAGSLNLFGNMKSEVSEWANSLDLGYGVTRLGDDDDFRKSDDKIIFISKYGYKATQTLSYSAILDVRSQFNYGYNYDKLDSNNRYQKISAFFAPGFITLGVGMNYQPTEYLGIMLSPISNRLIVVLDEDLSNEGAFGVDKGKKIKSELGSALNINFKKEIFTNVTAQSRLNIFSAFNRFTKAVVNWEALINMKVNDFLSANLAIDAIYDEKINIIRDNGTKGPATQFRNVLSLGLSYNFK